MTAKVIPFPVRVEPFIPKYMSPELRELLRYAALIDQEMVKHGRPPNAMVNRVLKSMTPDEVADMLLLCSYETGIPIKLKQES